MTFCCTLHNICVLYKFVAVQSHECGFKFCKITGVRGLILTDVISLSA
jgi:hypothetical protein